LIDHPSIWPSIGFELFFCWIWLEMAVKLIVATQWVVDVGYNLGEVSKSSSVYLFGAGLLGSKETLCLLLLQGVVGS